MPTISPARTSSETLSKTPFLPMAAGLQCHRPERALAVSGLARLVLAPDHQRHQQRFREVGDVAGADHAAVAQHRDAIGDIQHLAEAMRDVNDAEAVRLQFADDGKQVHHLVVVE